MNTNAGRKSTNKRGDVVGLDAKARTDEDSAANVFNFTDLADQHHVTHDNADEDAFMVQSWEDDQDNDVNLKFPRDKASRLCGYRFLTECTNRNKPPMCDEQDLEEIKHSEQETPNRGVQLLDTVAQNRKNFTSREFEQAKQARNLHHDMEHQALKSSKEC